ncbi:MAG: tetratricopeptide repeat protein [Myxococcota bacterium]|nr:tetratricopeptide repeat protein [Myxococcota bacterium]
MQEAPAAAPLAYVGGEVCAACHAAEAEAWRGSHHDLAMQEARPDTVLGDFDGAELTHFGVTTTFFRRDGAYLVRTEGPDGALHDYEVAYVFGVDPLQQVLLPLPGGRLQALTVAWDSRPASEGGQRWYSLYPDERIPPGDRLHWTGRDQSWNHMCADCHSTGLRKGYHEAEDAYDTRFEALDVSCEACHGPGSRHVERMQAPSARGGTGLAVRLGASRGAWRFVDAEPIARRVAGGDASEVESCGRCHARRALLHEADVPAPHLLDTHRPALLSEGLYHADGQILDEVYVYGSFLQSRMFAAGVTCGDCHDPHALGVRAEGNALCGGCHRPEVFDTPEHHHHEAGGAAARCTACHMPSRTYMGVDVRHDHGFKVPRPDLTGSLGVPNACQDCHADRPASWARDAVASWRGATEAPPRHFAEALAAGRRGLPGAGRALIRLADDRDAPGLVRATALDLLSRRGEPAPEATLEMGLGAADPLVRVAAAGAAETLPPDARVRLVAPLLRDPVRGVRMEAARVLADVPPARFPLGARAAQATALEEYRAAQRLHADRPESHLNLGLLRARRGELALAEAAYRRALARAPGFVPAAVNLADVHRLQERHAEAEATLRRALESAPASADLHHALGLALVRLGRREAALASLEQAASLAPERPRYAYVYAIALADAGERPAALATLAAAHALHPGSRELLLALATLERDAGNRAAALEWAQRLADLRPGDREAQALLASLERATP